MWSTAGSVGSRPSGVTWLELWAVVALLVVTAAVLVLLVALY
jgi:hypothetical protein